MSASKMAIKRLSKEHAAFQKDPPPFIWARPNESNILEWHAIFRGPPETPYVGGEYWAVVTFTKDYPFAPPELKMMTPSGRFTPNSPICTSMSNFHPGSWNVSWSIETILVGLLSFMLSEEITTGATKASDAERRDFASKSHAWNISQPKFRTIFPEYAGATMKDVPKMSGAAPPPAGPQGEGKAPFLSADAGLDAHGQGGGGPQAPPPQVALLARLGVQAVAAAVVVVAAVVWMVSRR